MSVRFRPEVAAMPRYVPGKPPGPGPDGRAYKLASNENPFDPLPSVRAALAECALNRYPDPGNAAITAALSARLGVAGESLVFGTGSVQVLAQLLSATCGPGDEVVFPWRSFEAYPLAVQMTGASAVPVPLAGAEHDLAAMADAITDRTRAVLLCSPNNPTGPALGADAVESFVTAVPDDVLVVLDEAYVEYVTDPAAVRGLDVLARHRNVVSLRTFSKAYGLAGLRVGFAVADPSITEVIQAATMPFATSVPAQVAVLASLAASDELDERVRSIVAERERVLAGLAELSVPVPDSQGNFFWLAAGIKGLDAAAWAERFDAVGLSVRAFHTGGPGDGVRVSIGEVEANDRTLEVIAAAG
ncbi:histidinol-phosphate transaminase [Enemella sp. A6]|uniref:histidinol-phosphate transaminase n=1 Tax=Enemella sp. A6 TaxID=3440152 RepID=UPI003EC10D7F